MSHDNRCLICWAIIPEGRQVCPDCERAMMSKTAGTEEKQHKQAVDHPGIVGKLIKTAMHFLRGK